MNKKKTSKPGPHPAQSPEYRGPLTAQTLADVFASCGDYEARPIDFGLEGLVFPTVCWL